MYCCLYFSAPTQSASPETLPAGDDGDEFGQFETAAVTPPCTSSLGYASTTSDRNECSAAAAVDSGYSGTISMVPNACTWVYTVHVHCKCYRMLALSSGSPPCERMLIYLPLQFRGQ